MDHHSRDTQDATVGLVVTGDNHLSPALPRLSPQQRQKRRAWLQRGFQAAADCAIERRAALFINTGDLFDSPAPSNQDRAFVAAQLHRLRAAGIVCIAISGNHDTPRMQTEHGGEAPQQVYAALHELHYIAANDLLEPQLLTLNGVNVAILGLSNNPVAAPGSDPLAGARWSDGAVETLAQADMALVILHAAIEGLSRPNEGERIVARASLDALPDICRLVVAGHIHRFARQRIGEREVVVVGATERMDFGGHAGAPGFVWAELTSAGVGAVEHIRTQAQPRADISLHASQFWPEDAPVGDEGGTNHALDVIRAELEAVCTPETMARLRLTGALSRERYHQLALRDVIALGQQVAFSLDVDTSGLTLEERAFALPTLEAHAEAYSPTQVLAQVVEETLRESRSGAPGLPNPADVRAAADLLLARLRASNEEGV
jgi:DNA repair exonuclease SbcCD nuclease subunit